MNSACQLPARIRSMFAKTTLILTLLLSLLFVTQARPAADSRAVKMPSCVAMVCMKPCCANMPCCATQPQHDPAPEQAPAPARGGVELAALAAQTFPFLYTLPAPQRRFVIRGEACAAHTLPPLAATCIRLI